MCSKGIGLLLVLLSGCVCQNNSAPTRARQSRAELQALGFELEPDVLGPVGMLEYYRYYGRDRRGNCYLILTDFPNRMGEVVHYNVTAVPCKKAGD